MDDEQQTKKTYRALSMIEQVKMQQQRDELLDLAKMTLKEMAEVVLMATNTTVTQKLTDDIIKVSKSDSPVGKLRDAIAKIEGGAS